MTYSDHIVVLLPITIQITAHSPKLKSLTRKEMELLSKKRKEHKRWRIWSMYLSTQSIPAVVGSYVLS